MFGKVEILHMAQTLARYSGIRQGLIAQNVAQADTPGYRARDLPPFADLLGEGAAALRATRREHIASSAAVAVEAAASGGAAEPNGNSVSLEQEMFRAAEVRQQHDMALAIYRSTADILRKSLGRG